MADVLLHEYVPQSLGAITPGEDNAYRINAAIWNLNKQQKPVNGLVRDKITVDQTLGSGWLWLDGTGNAVTPGKTGSTKKELKDLSGVCVKAEKAGAGFDWMTDRGPDLNYTAQNNRAHWRYVNPTNCGVCGLALTGTHTPEKPNRSPDEGTERDIWEGQSGIAFVGGKNSKAVGNTIKWVWGDGLAVAAYSVDGKAANMRVSDGHTFWNNSVERNGRVGLLMNGTSNFTCDGFVGKNIVSSYYHIEVATNPNLAQRNIHLKNGQWHSGNGRFVTFTSGAPVEDMYLEDNHLIGKPFTLHIATKVPGGFKRFTVARNVCDVVTTSDEFITAWNVYGFSLLSNVAPRDSKCKTFDADGKASCRDVVESGNKFPIV